MTITSGGAYDDSQETLRLVVALTHPEARPGAVVTPVPRALSADQQWQLLLVDVYARLSERP